jgi:hypothetical protein
MRSLLERHLHGRWEAREGEVEELASFGLAYLARLPESERRTARFVERIVARSARPGWTLLAMSHLLSGTIVWAMRSAFGAA